MNAITLTSWNRHATRFVEPPVFTWQRPPGATRYECRIATKTDRARVVRTTHRQLDLAALWPKLPCGPLDLLITGLNRRGTEVCGPASRRIFKVPGFDGRRQAPLDWAAAVRRNIAFLLAPARDRVRPYERGLPRSCWSSLENTITGERIMLAYPALHHPSYILAFLKFADCFPDDPLAAEARRQARQYGDWLLRHQQPRRWVCSRFPFSTTSDGQYHGGCEGANVTLFRAARVGEAMLVLWETFHSERYREYAVHLADLFVKLQQPDGSWPYRVNPATGKVVEAYTSNAVTPARFLGALEASVPAAKYRRARERALRWVLRNPVRTRLWQGMYEDVGAVKPYANLENWDVNEAIRYLVHYRRGNRSYVPVAEDLNRFIEDQFVVWQEEDSPVAVRCPTPTVLEQFVCYHPMEVHTGHWLLSLLALHHATGTEAYLVKGLAAANAIVRGQQPSGAFSTWGNDRRFGRVLDPHDWPGCNAFAATALLRWAEYYQAVRGHAACEPRLIGA